MEAFFETGVQEIEAVLAYVEGLGVEIQFGTALDFGCGVGRLSQALARRFELVEGVDISPAMIELAEQYNQHAERCRYHLNEKNNLSLFPDSTFDFIYSNITLQHMPPQFARAYIQEFLRLLTPAGILVFQIPSRPKSRTRALTQPLKPTRIWRFYQRLRYGDQPVMDMHGIPQEKVLRLLAANGGRVIDIQPDESADAAWQSFRYCVTRA